MKEEIQERIAMSLELIADRLEHITKQEDEILKQLRQNHKDQFESIIIHREFLLLRKLELSVVTSKYLDNGMKEVYDNLLKQEIEKHKK